MTLGQRIIKLRKDNKLSQEKLADKLKITRQTLSNYENDITIPDLDIANKIANYFNISLDELTGNNLTLIETKLNSNELLVKKNSKLLKILLITIYFILLISFIIIMIYFWNKKDFTSNYQTEITCYKTEQEYIEYIKLALDEQSYSCIGEIDGKILNYDSTVTYSCDESKRIYYYTINVYGIAKYYKDANKTTGDNFTPSDDAMKEKVLGGYSVKDAYDSLYTYKNLLIAQGYKCQ